MPKISQFHVAIIHPSSMQCRDSNLRPLVRQSPPMTTTPGYRPDKILAQLGSANNIRAGATTAQLIEWLLPIPEVGGSNPVIGKNLYLY